MMNLGQKMKFAWDHLILGRQRGASPNQVECWKEPPLLEAQLWFGDRWVADLHQLRPHQGTWMSEYELRITGDEGDLQRQLVEYVAFSGQFDRRMAEGGDHDFDEFEDFIPNPRDGSWAVRLPGDRSVLIEGRIWFVEGTTCWQHPATGSCAEAEASSFWIENPRS